MGKRSRLHVPLKGFRSSAAPVDRHHRRPDRVSCPLERSEGNVRRKLIIFAVFALAMGTAVTGFALATPSSGVVNIEYGRETRAKFTLISRIETSWFRSSVFAPGAFTGWLGIPARIVGVARGSVTLYLGSDPGCAGTTYDGRGRLRRTSQSSIRWERRDGRDSNERDVSRRADRGITEDRRGTASELRLGRAMAGGARRRAPPAAAGRTWRGVLPATRSPDPCGAEN